METVMSAIVEQAVNHTMTRIKGAVKRSFPDKGYFWIAGVDGTDYFGHASQIQGGTDIYSAWINQPCNFIPHQNGPDNRGPYAEAIVLE